MYKNSEYEKNLCDCKCQIYDDNGTKKYVTEFEKAKYYVFLFIFAKGRFETCLSAVCMILVIVRVDNSFYWFLRNIPESCKNLFAALITLCDVNNDDPVRANQHYGIR